MNDKLSKLFSFAVQNGIQIVRIAQLIENPNMNNSAFEPKWYVHVVLFEGVTVKRLAVHLNQQNELYLKPSQDMSLYRYGGNPMDSVQLHATIKEEIIKLIQKEVNVGQQTMNETMLTDAPQLPPRQEY